MIKGIGESLTVLRQTQTPSLATNGASVVKSDAPVSQGTRVLSQHKLASYRQWAVVTKEQHTISANQVVLASLTQIKSLLQQMGKTLHLAKQRDDVAGQGAWDAAENLRQAILLIDPRYQGYPLLDHHFNLISPRRPGALHAFVFKSVDLVAPKERDEQINLQIGAQIVTLMLAGGASRNALAKSIAPALANLGISVDLTADELILHATSDAWHLINQGVLMMGEGQRLPAGELRNVAVEARYSWQDPRQWELGRASQSKSSIAKINKVLKKIVSQIDELRIQQRRLAQQFQSRHDDLDEIMSMLERYLQPTPFSYQVKGLMAQSNTNRQQVSALLG